MTIKLLFWELPLYGLLFYTGMLVAGAVALIICKKRGIPKFDMVASAAYTMIGAGVGAKLLFILVSLKDIIALFDVYPAKDVIFSVLKGGFVFYGGLIGGAIGLFIYIKQFKMDAPSLVDIFATVLPLGHAIGRVGCFFAGCCYGMEYHGPLSHTYTEVIGNTPVGVPLLPIQLIESACLLMIFTALLIIYLKKSYQPFFCTKVYAIAYATVRFTLEFFRGDKERGSLLIFSTSQWISIAIISAVIVLSILRKKGILKSKKKNKQNNAAEQADEAPAEEQVADEQK